MNTTKPTNRRPARQKRQRKVVVGAGKLSKEQLEKYKSLRKKLQEWMADESGEQERSWEIYQRSLREHAASDRNWGNGE